MKKVIALVCLSVYFVSCNPSEQKQEVQTKRDSLLANNEHCDLYYKEAKMLDSVLMKSNSLNKELADRAINAFNTLGSECPLNTEAPIFLLKAGQIAQSVGKITQAQMLLKKCADLYRQFKNRGAALFLLAQLYDDASMLNNEDEAKTIYEQIIREYPNTAFANDSKAAIDNLGKTDEELIEGFLKLSK